MNAAFICCHSRPWLEVKKLMAEEQIYVKYWITWKDDIENLPKNEGVYYQTVEDAWQGRGFPENITPCALDKDIIDKTAYLELIALRMMDRLDLDRYSFNFSERQRHFRNLLGYWLNIIDTQCLELVVTPTAPHRVFDFALYAACQIRGVKFIFFQVTHFDEIGFLVDDIERYPTELTSYLKSNDAGSDVLPELADKVTSLLMDNKDTENQPYYMVDSKKEQDYTVIDKIKFYMEKLSRVGSVLQPVDIYHKERWHTLSDSRITKLSRFIRKEKQYCRVKKLKQYYDSHCVKAIPDKFILVALHYQPEETTCPNGGVFVEQGLIVNLLAECLPKDITILVKEHPFQFYRNKEGGASRDKDVYDEMLKSGRVQFVPTEYNQFDLVRKSEAVVTVTGTIGWEAAVRGKKVFLFGRSWYVGMPNVFSISNKKDLLSALESEGNYSASDIDSYHKRLSSRLINAPFYKSWGMESKRSEIESASTIYDEVSMFLKRSV